MSPYIAGLRLICAQKSTCERNDFRSLLTDEVASVFNNYLFDIIIQPQKASTIGAPTVNDRLPLLPGETFGFSLSLRKTFQ